MPKIIHSLPLYNTDTSVKRTLGSVPLVSVLKRVDCIGQRTAKPLLCFRILCCKPKVTFDWPINVWVAQAKFVALFQVPIELVILVLILILII